MPSSLEFFSLYSGIKNLVFTSGKIRSACNIYLNETVHWSTRSPAAWWAFCTKISDGLLNLSGSAIEANANQLRYGFSFWGLQELQLNIEFGKKKTRSNFIAAEKSKNKVDLYWNRKTNPLFLRSQWILRECQFGD